MIFAHDSFFSTLDAAESTSGTTSASTGVVLPDAADTVSAIPASKPCQDLSPRQYCPVAPAVIVGSLPANAAVNPVTSDSMCVWPTSALPDNVVASPVTSDCEWVCDTFAFPDSCVVNAFCARAAVKYRFAEPSGTASVEPGDGEISTYDEPPHRYTLFVSSAV